MCFYSVTFEKRRLTSQKLAETEKAIKEEREQGSKIKKEERGQRKKQGRKQGK